MASKATAAERRARFIGVTNERLAQACAGGDVIEVVNMHPSGLPHYDTVRFAGGEIARLARRGVLNRRLIEAAERLATLHHKARMDGPSAINPSRIVVDGGSNGVEMPLHVCNARRRYADAVYAIGPLCRPVVLAIVIEGMTIDEAGRLRQLARNRRDRATAALWVLKAGLDTLADHFGLHGERVEMPTGSF